MRPQIQHLGHLGTCSLLFALTAGCGGTAVVEEGELGQGAGTEVVTGSLGGSTALAFRNTSTNRDNSADWDYCFGKASCAPGEALAGVSQVASGKGANKALCHRSGEHRFPGQPTATLRLNGSDVRRGHRNGDWAYGYYKLECGDGEYISGISQGARQCGGENSLHAVRCSRGVGLSNQCTTRVFEFGDDRGSRQSGDWDPTFIKGECNFNEYAVGVSAALSSGRLHSLLCCQLGPMPLGTPAPANPTATFSSIYQPFEVVPGVSVPRRLGIHWGPGASDGAPDRIRNLATRMRQMGLGYSSVIVDMGNVEGSRLTLETLLQQGIQPLVRFVLPGGEYNRPVDKYSQAELELFVQAAKQVRALGVRLVRIDNEPNFEPVADRGLFAANVAYLLNAIRVQIPDMAVGTPPMGMDPSSQSFFSDLMWFLKWHNEHVYGGHLFDRAFLAVHPYDSNREGEGTEQNAWYRGTAAAITGHSFRTLASEGGTPTSPAGPVGEAASARVVESDLRFMASHPEETQMEWLIADGFLTRSTEPGVWDHHALVHLDGSESAVLTLLRQIATGQK